jgi:hypothetical protein
VHTGVFQISAIDTDNIEIDVDTKAMLDELGMPDIGCIVTDK